MLLHPSKLITARFPICICRPSSNIRALMAWYLPLQAPHQPSDHNVAHAMAEYGANPVGASRPDADAAEDVGQTHQPAVSAERRSGPEPELGHAAGAAPPAAGIAPEPTGLGGSSAVQAQDRAVMEGEHPSDSLPAEPTAGCGRSAAGEGGPGAAGSDVASPGARQESGSVASAIAAPNLERDSGRLITAPTSMHATAVDSSNSSLAATQPSTAPVAAPVTGPASDPQPTDSGLDSRQQPHVSVVSVPQADPPGPTGEADGDPAQGTTQDRVARAEVHAQPSTLSQPQAMDAVPAGGMRSAEAHGELARPGGVSQPRALSEAAEADEPIAEAAILVTQPGAASHTQAAEAYAARPRSSVEAPTAPTQLAATSLLAGESAAEEAVSPVETHSAHAQLDNASPPNAAAAVTAVAAGGSSASVQAPSVHEQLEAGPQPEAVAATAEDDAPSGPEVGLGSGSGSGEPPRTLTGSKRAAKRQRRRQREAAARRANPDKTNTAASLELAAVLPAVAAAPKQSSRAAKRARTQTM